MKYPLTHPCFKCQKPTTTELDVAAEMIPAWTCGSCNESFPEVELPLNLEVGEKLLNRATAEYRKGDHDACVVFSAMAVDCQISAYYFKWDSIDNDTYDDKYRIQQLETLRTNYRTVSSKIEGVSELMTNGNVKEFVSGQSDLKEAVEQRFKSLNLDTLPQDIQRELFHRRNRIIHHCDKQSTEEEARKAFSWGQLMVAILKRMDLSRRQAMRA